MQQYDEEDEAALADLVSKKGQQAADDAINNVGEAKVSLSKPVSSFSSQ